MTEAQLTKRLMTVLAGPGFGCEVLTFTPSRFSPTGIPDRYVFHPCFGAIWMEMKKAPGGRIAPLQMRMHCRLNSKGAIAVFAMLHENGCVEYLLWKNPSVPFKGCVLTAEQVRDPTFHFNRLRSFAGTSEMAELPINP